jgi:hypothetical protein
MHSIADREAAITQMAESEEWTVALRAHVQEIIEGEAFKGSIRCARFLSYIVERSISGHFDSLKERVIGLELFERSPAYDTSEDAIVRVTASDVRKRLLQHYGKYGAASEFRISLPLGSYIPEIIRTPADDSTHSEGLKQEHAGALAVATREAALKAAPAEITPPAIAIEAQAAPAKQRSTLWWITIAGVLTALNLGIWVLAWNRAPRSEAEAALPSPWAAFFSSSHPIHLITSDPDIAAIQILTGSRISVSDYANHNYLPEQSKVSDEIRRFCLTILGGDKAASIDAQIAANLGAIAKSASRTLEVQGARSFQFSNLKTDDNFIFLGSPSSDPWSSVFSDQLDFRIVPGNNPGGEVIENAHPAAGEQRLYVPTAKGGATGESYAIVAFIGNPDQYGQVLLLAGADREGTQAAGKLVSDLPRLSAALRKCGLQPSGELRHFEMLLHVKTMAGFPNQFDVVACHLLPGPSSR